MPKTVISQGAINMTHYSANYNVGSWITPKHWHYFLCCEPFWAPWPSHWILKASQKHLEAGEILHGSVNAPEMLHFWFKHGLYISSYYSCSVCADCSGLRFPRATLCGCYFLYSLLRRDDGVTWSDLAINRLYLKENDLKKKKDFFMFFYWIADINRLLCNVKAGWVCTRGIPPHRQHTLHTAHPLYAQQWWRGK